MLFKNHLLTLVPFLYLLLINECSDGVPLAEPRHILKLNNKEITNSPPSEFLTKSSVVGPDGKSSTFTVHAKGDDPTKVDIKEHILQDVFDDAVPESNLGDRTGNIENTSVSQNGTDPDDFRNGVADLNCIKTLLCG